MPVFSNNALGIALHLLQQAVGAAAGAAFPAVRCDLVFISTLALQLQELLADAHIYNIPGKHFVLAVTAGGVEVLFNAAFPERIVPLGIIKDAESSNGNGTLAAGDVIIMSTDGVREEDFSIIEREVKYFNNEKENIKGDLKYMTIEIKRNAEEVILQITGRLDTTTAPALDKAIAENINAIKNLVLDFKSLEYISSAGLRVLLAAQKKMQKIGSMKVTGVCEEVMEVFEMTGFSDILTIE